jgi:hypothetical protein
MGKVVIGKKLVKQDTKSHILIQLRHFVAYTIDILTK